MLAERAVLFALARAHRLLELREHADRVFVERRAAQHVEHAACCEQRVPLATRHRHAAVARLEQPRCGATIDARQLHADVCIGQLLEVAPHRAFAYAELLGQTPPVCDRA